jgi:hypothetical protein
MLENVTKEYKMHEKAYIVGVTSIALSIIYLSWGFDSPICNFAICFGGVLLGHVITEILNTQEN